MSDVVVEQEQFVLTKEGREIHRGTESACLQRLHRVSSTSWQYATRYCGYDLVRADEFDTKGG